MGLEVLVAHALRTARPRGGRRIESLRTRSSVQIAQRVAEDSLRPLTRSGQRVSSVVLSATDPVERLVTLAEERSASLVVTGAEVELASEAEPFLGHDTERLLDEVRSAVVVVLLPPPPTTSLPPEPKGVRPSGPA